MVFGLIFILLRYDLNFIYLVLVYFPSFPSLYIMWLLVLWEGVSSTLCHQAVLFYSFDKYSYNDKYALLILMVSRFCIPGFKMEFYVSVVCKVFLAYLHNEVSPSLPSFSRFSTTITVRLSSIHNYFEKISSIVLCSCLGRFKVKLQFWSLQMDWRKFYQINCTLFLWIGGFLQTMGLFTKFYQIIRMKF